MLISLADPKSFLKKAVLLTCLLASGVQAVPLSKVTPVEGAAYTQTVEAPISAKSLGLEIESSKIVGSDFFNSKSLRGDTIQHVHSSSEAAHVLTEEGDHYAFASKIITDSGNVACVVSTAVPTQSRLDAESIHYGLSEDSGFITNPYLARMMTTYHEFGHCLDFVSTSAHMKNQADMKIGTFLMTGMIVSEAAASQDGYLNFDLTLGKTPAQIESVRQDGRDFAPIGVSLMETYADLQGTFQTAAATGDISGFTEFALSFRQSEDLKLTHSTGLAVANIIQKEIAGGLDISSLKGKSNGEITDMVNHMFVEHFCKDGQMSIHSDGFKDIIKDMSIKIELGAEASDALAGAVDMLATKTGASPTIQDKDLYVGLTEINLNSQKAMVDKSASGKDPVISQLIAVKEAHLSHVKEGLGVDKPNEYSAFAGQDGHKDNEFRTASRMAQKLSVGSSGLEVNREKGMDFLRDISAQRENKSTIGLNP